MRREDKDLDQIIFDYIEGELPLEDKEVFELRMLKDDEIKEQVDIWKETIIWEDFNYTNELEQKLFIKSRRQWWTLSLNSFISICFLLLLMPSDLMDEDLISLNYQTVSSPIKDENIEKKQNLFARESDSYRSEKTSKKPIKESKSISLKNLGAEEKPSDWSVAIQIKKGFDLQHIFMKNSITVNPIKFKKARRILSQKEVRALERKMRKDTENRVASEFRKGNIPYVVPLDVSNF